MGKDLESRNWSTLLRQHSMTQPEMTSLVKLCLSAYLICAGTQSFTHEPLQASEQAKQNRRSTASRMPCLLHSYCALRASCQHLKWNPTRPVPREPPVPSVFATSIWQFVNLSSCIYTDIWLVQGSNAESWWTSWHARGEESNNHWQFAGEDKQMGGKKRRKSRFGPSEVNTRILGMPLTIIIVKREDS